MSQEQPISTAEFGTANTTTDSSPIAVQDQSPTVTPTSAPSTPEQSSPKQKRGEKILKKVRGETPEQRVLRKEQEGEGEREEKR